MRSRRKSAAQLDREIAAALANPRALSASRRHHSTVLETTDDVWLVVMDALMSRDPKRAAEVWNKLYDEHGATVPPERFTKALKSKSKTKIDKTVLDEFKHLAPMFESSLKRNALIADSGMGGFLDPPDYPTHSFHIQTDLGRRIQHRGSMSLESAEGTDSAWLDPTTRKEARELLNKWKSSRPPLSSPKVQKWISEVLGYMRSGYRNPNVAGSAQWNASNLIFDAARSPVANADDHAGVRLIRKFYPEYIPTEEDFANARWGA